MKKKQKTIVWYAKGGGIAKIGPYPTQVAATNAIRLEPPRITRESHILHAVAVFPVDAFVWPEEK